MQGYISGGVSGFSGFSGYSGISGYSGYSGTSGISGFSGYSGYSGVSGGQNGPLAVHTITVNAATISSGNDTIMCDTSSVTIPSQMLFLYTAAGNTGKRVYFKKIDNSIRSATISGNGSQTVDGLPTFVITDTNQGFTIISDGSNWQRLE